MKGATSGGGDASCSSAAYFFKNDGMLLHFFFENGGYERPMVKVTSLLLALLFVYLLVSKLVQMHVLYRLRLLWEYWTTSVPHIEVETSDLKTALESPDYREKLDKIDIKNTNTIPCHDPSTGKYLGCVPNMTAEEVHELCEKASAAQQMWCKTTYAQRRQVLRTIQRYVLANLEEIVEFCSRDSGKTALDAMLGEVLTTCEKIRTINADGELWLRPTEAGRGTGPLMMHKRAYVEYLPLGVVATIAPWNYPFHNLLNHVISGIFAGNAVVT